MEFSVTTVQVVVLANFISLLVVWTCVLRSYPSLRAARWWQAAMLMASAAAGISLSRGVLPLFIPVVIGNGLMFGAVACAAAGVREFYDQPLRIGFSAGFVATVCLSLGLLLALDAPIAWRMTLVSISQGCLFLGMMRDLAPHRQHSPGARLLFATSTLLTAMFLLRSFAALTGLGGPLSNTHFNPAQALLLIVLAFGSMMANFGFLLMAVDRLREEVGELAHADDLTGIANRRRLIERLEQACAQADSTGAPLTLMAVDLDAFKSINDSFGHGAGDECLRAFTRIVAARLRPGDLLARAGGDEFFVLVPNRRLTEAALLARDIVNACRATRVQWNGHAIPMTASIGVAEWMPKTGRDPSRLIVEADQALYVAKAQGRDRLAIYEEPRPRLRQIA